MDITLKNQVLELGRKAGKNMASWVFDGNTDQETYRIVLDCIKAGDLAILDTILSGECADSPTSNSLADDLGIEQDDDRLDDLCSLWEDAAFQSFWDSIKRTCRYHLS